MAIILGWVVDALALDFLILELIVHHHTRKGNLTWPLSD